MNWYITFSDSAHEIVDDVQLLGGYKLHRYANTAGVPCSAIYSEGGFLCFSAPRDREEALIECWNKLVEECC